MHIAVIDLGIGNLRSVAQAVLAVNDGAEVTVTSDAAVVDNADKVILPGQGAVGSWFRELNARHLTQAVNRALSEKPLLGICVGMQALFSYCEEDGGLDGLGVFDGEVRHFQNFLSNTEKQHVTIPQMGWNQVSQTQAHPLWHGIEDGSNFYFLHSYCANLSPEADDAVVAGTADYYHEYVASVARDNVFATQFHPEKSHDDGLQLIRNFCHWDGRA